MQNTAALMACPPFSAVGNWPLWSHANLPQQDVDASVVAAAASPFVFTSPGQQQQQPHQPHQHQPQPQQQHPPLHSGTHTIYPAAGSTASGSSSGAMVGMQQQGMPHGIQAQQQVTQTAQQMGGAVCSSSVLPQQQQQEVMGEQYVTQQQLQQLLQQQQQLLACMNQQAMMIGSMQQQMAMGGTHNPYPTMSVPVTNPMMMPLAAAPPAMFVPGSSMAVPASMPVNSAAGQFMMPMAGMMPGPPVAAAGGSIQAVQLQHVDVTGAQQPAGPPPAPT